MGGEVGFDSTEGQGFDLLVRHRRARSAAPPNTSCRAASDELEGLSVLVVDDNAANRTIVSKILETLAAVVETREDGAARLQAAARLVPSVILMDVQMPGMDGLEGHPAHPGPGRSPRRARRSSP